MYKNLRKILVLSLAFIVLSVVSQNLNTNFNKNDNSQENFYEITDDLLKLPNSSLARNLTDIIKVSDSPNTQTPKIAIDRDNNIHIVWSDKIDGNWDILYRNFTYATQQWSSIYNVSDSDQSSQFPAIAIDENNNIMIVWIEGTEGLETYVYCRIFKYNTKTWTTIEEIGVDHDNIKSAPTLANSTGGNFTVVYSQQRTSGDGKYEIYYRNYRSITEDWGYSRSITYSDNLMNPSVYFDKNNKGHLVFMNQSSSDTRSIMYTNFTWDSSEVDYVFGFKGYLNVTKNLRGNNIGNEFATYALNYPSILAVPELNQVFVAWHNNWYSSRAQIQWTNFTLTNYISESLLNSQIYNITQDTTYYHVRPHLSYGFNSTNPMIIWTSTEKKIKYVESLTSAIDNYSPVDIDNIAENWGSDIKWDSHYSLYGVFTGERNTPSNKEVWLRKYDTWHPQLQVISPNNNLFHVQHRDGNISFVVAAEPDTISVKYEYYNDTNKNFIEDDGGDWGLLAWINSSTQQFNYQWNTTDPERRSYPKIIFRITAYDSSYLNTTLYRTNITIDNHGPENIFITQVKDTFGNTIPNSAGADGRVAGILNFTYTVSDSLSKVAYVELWNKTTFIANNITSGNNVNITWDSSGIDGNFTELFLRAYDDVGNYNDSAIFQRKIIVDNTIPSFEWVDIEQGKQYTGTSKDIKIRTLEDDTLFVKFYYSNISTPETPIGTGDGVYIDGNWSITWNYASLDGNYTIKVQVRDLTGWEFNDTIYIYIDHTRPTVRIIYPSYDGSVGSRVDVIIEADIDTVVVELYNKSSELSPTYDLANVSYTIISENATHRNFSATFLTYTLPSGSFHYLKARGNDSIGWGLNTSDVRIKITDRRPYPISVYFEGSYEKSGNTYKAILSWRTPILSENVTKYYIYRFTAEYTRNEFDNGFRQYLNSLGDAKLDYLGRFTGDKYCVKEFNSSDGVVPLLEGNIETYYWNDTGIAANNYFYIIVAVNDLNLPGNCSEIAVQIKITPETPATNPDYRLINAYPYMIVGYIVGCILLGTASVKSARARRYRREVKEIIVEQDDKKFTKKGEKSLEERLDEMEIMAEMSVKEDLGKQEYKVIKSEMDIGEEDKILDFKISPSEEENKETQALAGPRRCPHCNWIISSTATKCPRCGKMV